MERISMICRKKRRAYSGKVSTSPLLKALKHRCDNDRYYDPMFVPKG